MGGSMKEKLIRLFSAYEGPQDLDLVLTCGLLFGQEKPGRLYLTSALLGDG